MHVKMRSMLKMCLSLLTITFALPCTSCELMNNPILLQESVRRFIVSDFSSIANNIINSVQSLTDILRDLETSFTELQERLFQIEIPISDNPINVVKFVHQSSQKIQKSHNLLEGEIDFVKEIYENIQALSELSLSEEDLTDSVKGILRIQSIYNSTVDEMIGARVAGLEQPSRPLSIAEVVHIASYAQQMSTPTNSVFDALPQAVTWTDAATRLAIQGGLIEMANGLQVALLESTREYYRQRRCECSLQDLQSEADWQRRNKHLLLPRRTRHCSQNLAHCPPKHDPFGKVRTYFHDICQGKHLAVIKRNSKDLQTASPACRYDHNGNNWLQVGPIKVEDITISKPRITLYHHAMTDTEIDTLLKIGTTNLMPSKVFENSSLQLTEKRISSQNHLTDMQSSSVLSQFLRRIESATGYTLTSQWSDKPRVIGYAVGGFFDVHSDYVETSNAGDNNRMATMLVYLNDVASGGDTVFPWINLRLRPTKGAAVIWENQSRAGRNQRASVHAACPVLAGQKWIYVHHIMKFGNEFTKPCALTESD